MSDKKEGDTELSSKKKGNLAKIHSLRWKKEREDGS